MVNRDDAAYEASIGSELYRANLQLNTQRVTAMLRDIFRFRALQNQTEENVYNSLVQFAEQAGIDDVAQLFATAMILLDAWEYAGHLNRGKETE